MKPVSFCFGCVEVCFCIFYIITLKCNKKQYVIFSTAGFTKGLEEEATRNQRLLLVDTFTPREK